MSKPRVFVTRLILASGLTLIRDFCEADIWPDELPPSREAILKGVSGMDGLLCLLTDRIDAGIMEAARMRVMDSPSGARRRLAVKKDSAESMLV